MKFIYKLLLFLNVLLLVPTVVSLWAPDIDPKASALPGIIAGGFPVYILLLIGFTVFWLAFKWKYSFLSLVVIFFARGEIQGHYGLGKSKETKGDIHIASFNLFGLRKLKKAENKVPLAKNLRAVLEKPNYDIICLQENNLWADAQLKKLLDNKYGYTFQHSGVKVFSKYEIIDKGSFDFNSAVNGCIWTDLNISGKTTRLYCAHLKSNRVSKDADLLWEEGDLSERKTWSGVRSILSKYKHAAIERKDQCNLIKTHANKSNHATIICGDLNDHPLSYSYNVLSSDMKDAFRESGRGVGTTYDGRPPFLRIDYILCDSTLLVDSYGKTATNVSDHFLIHSTLSYNN